MLAVLDKKEYRLISLLADIKTFEVMMWSIYHGETTSTGLPFVVSNLLLDDVDEISEYVSCVMLRDAIQEEGVEQGTKKPTPERTVRYMELAMQDVVAFLMNHSLPFVYIDYKEQGVRKRWVRMPQREVW